MNYRLSTFNYQINDWDTVCFRAGTKISMFDGSKKTIESIKIGDSVKAFNEKTGQFVDSKVNNVFKKQTSSYLQITLDNGEIIEVTPEHPFYTNTGWLAAKELKQNSLIKAINGFISVQSINQVKEQSEVYNFEVEDNHTYLAYGAVVHNKCSPNNPYLVAWKNHKAKGGTALDFGFEGEVSNQDFIDFLSTPEGNAYITERGITVQQINMALYTWEASKIVSGIGLFKWFWETVLGNDTILRSLDNPISLKGATVQEVENLIPKTWIKEPSTRGGEIRFRDPLRPGDQIRIMPGQKNDPNPIKRGLYIRISIRGVKSNPIPLKGNQAK